MAFEPITNEEIEDAMVEDLRSGVDAETFSQQSGVDTEGYYAASEIRRGNPFFEGVLGGVTIALNVLRKRGTIE